MKPSQTILTTNEKICYKPCPIRNSIATISMTHNSFSCFLMFHYFSVFSASVGSELRQWAPCVRPNTHCNWSVSSVWSGEVMRGPQAHGTNCGIRSLARWSDLSLALIIDWSVQEKFTDSLLYNIFWYRISLVYQGRLPGADITHWQNLLDMLNIDFSYQKVCKVHCSVFITSEIRNTNVNNQLIITFF